jgi:lipopolysaccharide export system permease protein
MIQIPIVDRLIFRELVGPLLNGIFMFLAVLFGGAYLFSITELLVKGAPFLLVMKIALFTLPALVTQAFPMGMLLGTLLAFGRLSGDSEHIAMYAGGISFMRMARPVAAMGLVVSTITFIWNETVVPPSQRAFYELKNSASVGAMASNRPLHYVVKRQGEDTVDEFVSIDGGYDTTTRTLRRVTILKMSEDPARKGKPEVVVYAERVAMQDAKAMDADFFDGYVRYLSDGKVVADASFKEAHTRTLPKNVRLGRDFKGILRDEVVDNRRMTFSELRDKINRDRAEGKPETGGDEVDLWEKVSLPIASIIFGLVAAPLGVRPHRGSKAMGFGIAIGIIFLYWVLYRWMYVLGKGGGIPPVVASFLPCTLGLFAAWWLIQRTRQ